MKIFDQIQLNHRIIWKKSHEDISNTSFSKKLLFLFYLIKTFIHPTLTVKTFFKLKNAALGIFLINDNEILEAK